MCTPQQNTDGLLSFKTVSRLAAMDFSIWLSLRLPKTDSDPEYEDPAHLGGPDFGSVNVLGDVTGGSDEESVAQSFVSAKEAPSSVLSSEDEFFSQSEGVEEAFGKAFGDAQKVDEISKKLGEDGGRSGPGDDFDVSVDKRKDRSDSIDAFFADISTKKNKKIVKSKSKRNLPAKKHKISVISEPFLSRPKKSFGNIILCMICSKAVSKDDAIPMMGTAFHSACFRCSKCKVALSTDTFQIFEGKPKCPGCMRR
eukprot:212528_1